MEREKKEWEREREGGRESKFVFLLNEKHASLQSYVLLTHSHKAKPFHRGEWDNYNI